MREILFKGKTIEEGKWIEGSLIIDEKDNYYVGNYIESKGNCSYYCTNRRNGKTLNRFIGIGFAMVDKDTVCEYTQLKDKNGKRIWENDIVHLTDVRYETEWRAIVEFGNPYGEYTWGWNFYHIGEKAKVNTDILLWAEMEDVEVYCEVIGNRFDNSELFAERIDDK